MSGGAFDPDAFDDAFDIEDEDETIPDGVPFDLEDGQGMTFAQLYGDELDRELGTEDRSVLFTLARRKAAINAAQQEFTTRTDCFKRQGSLTLVSGTQEYDLEGTFADFAWLQAQGIKIRIVSGSHTRYLSGDGVQRTTLEALDTEHENWQADAAGTPSQWYTRIDAGAVFLGFYPAPSITGSDVWTAIVPYVAVTTDMVDDTEQPFSIATNPVRSLRPFHRALVHFAAYDLEKFRKDQGRSASQLQLWEVEIAKYIATQKPRQGQRVRMAVHYRRSLNPLTPRRFNPRA
jgi:hypothetical protein